MQCVVVEAVEHEPCWAPAVLGSGLSNKIQRVIVRERGVPPNKLILDLRLQV